MENTNIKPEVKFPIAAILEVIIAFATIITQTVSQIAHLHDYNYNPLFIIELLLSVIAPIMLCILLFMRKRSGVLTIPFFIFVLLAVKNICIARYIGNPTSYLSIIAQNTILILEDALIIFFIFAMYYRPEGGLARFCKAIWFVPGILSVLQAMLNFIFSFGGLRFGMGAGAVAASIMNIIGACFGAIVGTAFMLLLGWWITRPFKQQSPVYSYAQPANGQSAVYCSSCGAPLAPGTAFCSKCGKSVNGN